MSTGCFVALIAFLLCPHSEGTVGSNPGRTNREILRELEEIADTLAETKTENEVSVTTTDEDNDQEISSQGTMPADVGPLEDAQKESADTLEKKSEHDVLVTTTDQDNDQEISRLGSMLTDLDTLEDALQDKKQVTYEAVGCYKDNQVSPRPLPELLADLRSIVNWHALDKVIVKCAQLAVDKGYTYFGLQSLGQCMSGKDAEKTFSKDGGSSGCIRGLGNKSENSVYRIIVQDAEDGCYKHAVLSCKDRSMTYSNQSLLKCDQNLSPGWYRFMGDAGTRMPTSCVPTHNCGTRAPGWLNGQHPNVSEGVVVRRVCFHWSGGCCAWHVDVNVKNCDGFYVYKFEALPDVCDFRFCGNGEGFSTTQTPTRPLDVSTTQSATRPSGPTTIAPISQLTSGPEECEIYTKLSSVKRSVNFNQSVDSCDNKLPQGWYRFVGNAGNMMPTSCITKGHCDAHAPGWLTGEHPAVHDGQVIREVCFTWKSCCSWKTSIRIRNCGSFFVYYLAPTPTCNLRYCGNGQGLTTSGPPTTSKPATTEFTTPAETTQIRTPQTGSVKSTRPSTTSIAPTTTTTPSRSLKTSSGVPTTTSSECSNYKFLEEPNRAQTYQTNNRSAKCDKTLKKAWYRFRGGAGDHMPTSCVERLRCGTHAPGWLNGTHPSVNCGAVNATVCFHWSKGCCHWSVVIRVRNCGGFFVYELNRLPYCDLRFCGNGGQDGVLTRPSTQPTRIVTERPSPGLECIQYRVLRGGDRSQNYDYRQRPKTRALCDKNLRTAWYRFQGLAGNRMPDACVETHRCRTHAPGWLQGKHPSVSEGVVSRKACFSWGNSCCRWSTIVSVKNCGAFYVYKLQKPPTCRLRYSMHVQISRNWLPPLFDPNLLHLDDPNCGLVRMDQDHVALTAPLDSCGTTRRSIGGKVSFHNKVVADPGDKQKRSVFAEFPFNCAYRQFKVPGAPSNKFTPMYSHGQMMDTTFGYDVRDE